MKFPEFALATEMPSVPASSLVAEHLPCFPHRAFEAPPVFTLSFKMIKSHNKWFHVNKEPGWSRIGWSMIDTGTSILWKNDDQASGCMRMFPIIFKHISINITFLVPTNSAWSRWMSWMDVHGPEPDVFPIGHCVKFHHDYATVWCCERACVFQLEVRLVHEPARHENKQGPKIKGPDNLTS